jgi:transcription antitermination factor NusG
MMKRWFALQVHAGREKWIASYLEDFGFQHLLLLRRETHRWSDRPKTIEIPLFAGYVFCRFELEERVRVLSGPGVLRIVGCGKTPVPVEETEISSLQMLNNSGFPIHECPYLHAGDSVRIEGGSLDGVVGCFVKSRGCDRVVVSVTILQRSVAVEIDRSRVTLVHTIPAPRHAAREQEKPDARSATQWPARASVNGI